LLICYNVSSQQIIFTLTFLDAAQLGMIVFQTTRTMPPRSALFQHNCGWISWPNKVHTGPKHALNLKKLYNLLAKLTYPASTIHLLPLLLAANQLQDIATQFHNCIAVTACNC